MFVLQQTPADRCDQICNRCKYMYLICFHYDIPVPYKKVEPHVMTGVWPVIEGVLGGMGDISCCF